jgi:NAD dependent epimerase/dehydratase family enzyme
VLGPGKDGPLHKMLYPVPGAPFLSPWKLGLGGPIGGGRQWLPWVHRDDVIGLILLGDDAKRRRQRPAQRCRSQPGHEP